MKIVKFLEDSGVLVNGVTETIENETYVDLDVLLFY